MLYDDSHYSSQLAALSLWAQQRFEPTSGRSRKERLRKVLTKESALLQSKAFLFCCLVHLRVLNGLADGVFIKESVYPSINTVLQALVYSYLENHFRESAEPLHIFRFLSSRFGLLPDLDQEFCDYGRGRVILQVLRCLHQHKGSSRTLTLLFVCACRCYGISARLVCGICGPTSVSLFAEVFDTESGSWKRVDMSSHTYDGERHEIAKVSGCVNKETLVTYVDFPSCEHRGYLYIRRQNKVFVYRKGEDLTVVAILLLPKDCENGVVLNVKEFPFEEAQLQLRLVQGKQKPDPKSSRREYVYVFGCNSFGWLSELTPKYIERFNDAYIKRGKTLHEWLLRSIDLLNDRVKKIPKASLVSLLEKAEAKWMDARVSNDPLPAHKSKFKNHPIYVLASQIGNSRIKRKDVAPIAFLKGEEVFLRSDFEDLKTCSGWLKVNRRVIENAKPIAMRTVYHRDKRMHVQTSLFSESQTVLIAPKQMCDGQIPTTDYDNVDATGEKFIPHGTIYVRSKNPDLLFRTVKLLQLYHKRAFSSYQKNDSSRPEIDGVVIRKCDLPALLKKYEELATEKSHADVEMTKESHRNFWRSVFKTMLADPPSVAQEHHRKIRKELSDHVSQFLNNLQDQS